MIKFGSVSLISAVVLAGALTTPASAQDETARLIRHIDGTLEVVTGDTFTQAKAAGDQVLAVETKTVVTSVEPVTETAQAFSYVPFDKRANDPYRWNQWGLDWLNAEEVWKTTQGDGITVAVLDTGIYKEHPDFEGRVIRGFTAPGSTPGDTHGHGTHVAGIIAAASNNHKDIAGLAPKVTIWEGKISGDDGKGTSTDMAAGIAHAVNAGVDVINISMTSESPMPMVQIAIQEANKKGIPVIISAGNDGIYGSRVRYPAAYDEAFAVGAIKEDGYWAAFSNTNDYVDVTAPGKFIAGLNYEGGMMYMSGTSQAAPMVAASMALLKAYNPSLVGEDLKRVLKETSTGALHTISLTGALDAVKPEVKDAPIEDGGSQEDATRDEEQLHSGLDEDAGQSSEFPVPIPSKPVAPVPTPPQPVLPQPPVSQPLPRPLPPAPQYPLPAPAPRPFPAPVPAPQPVAPRPAVPSPQLPKPTPAPSPIASTPTPWKPGVKPAPKRKPNAPAPVHPIFHYERPVR